MHVATRACDLLVDRDGLIGGTPSASPSTSKDHSIDVASIKSDTGFAYTTVIESSVGTPDSMSNTKVSTLRLFENGTELGPAHATHADIEMLGKGHFSHWLASTGTYVAIYFSTSDNTDPRTNRRTYTYRVDGTPPR